MNRKRTTFGFVVLGLVLVLMWVLPASAAPLKQVGPTIQVIPDTAAPGTQITIQGESFGRATAGSVLFFWDALGQYPIGSAGVVSNGSFIDIATIPPNATPGQHTLIAFDNNSQTQASAQMVVMGDVKKGLYIYDTDAAAAKNFQGLMSGRGMLAVDVVSLARLSGADFSKYGLIVAGADTGLWDSKELAPEITRLLRSQKPIFALGTGGFELLRRMNLQNGKLRLLDTAQSGISVPDHTNPIFQTPYRFLNGSITLYRAALPLRAVEIPTPVHHVLQLGNAIELKGYSSMITEERRFMLWGFSADPAALTAEGEMLMVNAAWQLLLYDSTVDTLILTDYERMTNLGYAAADVDNLAAKINALVALPQTQSHMDAAVRNLGTIGTAALHTARTNWMFEGAGTAPGITSVSITNAYVNAIDAYIEQLKQNNYPNLQYVVFVGSHEVIPMKARDTDDMSSHPESSWAAGLPAGVLSYNYFKSLYQDPGVNGLGHYLTDTIYSDLSYVNNSNGADDELIPELGVGRLVETPNQISTLIDNYMVNSGHVASGGRASIASNDYMDGGQYAANLLGTATDTSLIQTTFNTNLVPTVMNAHNAIVYLAGHGNYNYIAPGFLAGSDASHGDTEELTMLANSVVVTSGCHNGVNFGNMRYHDYSGNTTYGEFPERMANGDVGVYLGATGYTWISGTGNSTNPDWTGWNEKLSVLFLKHLLQDGMTSSPGKSMKAAVNEYLGAAPDWDSARRVITIATLYGFPTYRPPQWVVSKKSAVMFGYSLFWKSLLSENSAQEATIQANQDITLEINDWSVAPDGLIQIPGADYLSGGDVPVLPVIAANQLFPPGTQVSSVIWDEAASVSTTLTNDVPLFQKQVNDDVVPNTFSSREFYPSSPFASSQTSTLGDGGVNLTLSIYPVQYNQATHQTRIWTRLVFHVTYAVETISADVDSDADGLPDYWETAYGMSPNNEVGGDGPSGDLDGDGLTNGQEFTYGTDPSNPDSDGDGKTDGEEAADGTNPLNPGEREYDVYIPLIKK